jgi:hypothetical protein
VGCEWTAFLYQLLHEVPAEPAHRVVGVEQMYDIVDQTNIIPDRSGTVKLLRAISLRF